MSYFYTEEGIHSGVFLPLGKISFKVGHFNYDIDNSDGSHNRKYVPLDEIKTSLYRFKDLNLKALSQEEVDEWNIKIKPKHNRQIIKLIFRYNGDK